MNEMLNYIWKEMGQLEKSVCRMKKRQSSVSRQIAFLGIDCILLGTLLCRQNKEIEKLRKEINELKSLEGE